MEIETSNRLPDRTQYIVDEEVAEEISSQATGGGALVNAATLGGGIAIGAGGGAAFGAAVSPHNPGQGASIGSGIGGAFGTGFATSTVMHNIIKERSIAIPR